MASGGGVLQALLHPKLTALNASKIRSDSGIIDSAVLSAVQACPLLQELYLGRPTPWMKSTCYWSSVEPEHQDDGPAPPEQPPAPDEIDMLLELEPEHQDDGPAPPEQPLDEIDMLLELEPEHQDDGPAPPEQPPAPASAGQPAAPQRRKTVSV
eukprot:gene1914-63_t